MNNKTFLITIFISALILRLGYVHFFIGFNAEVIRDGTFFDNVALNMIEGKGISIQNGIPTAKKPPVYLFLLAGLYKIFGRNLVLVRVFQCIIGALLPVIIYLISKKLYSDAYNVSKLAAVFTALYPPLIFLRKDFS